MDGFIKKIFEGKSEKDDLVHVQFQKFSRGEFKDKAVIIYSKSKDKYTLSTTYEYANEFVRLMAEKLGSNKAKVTGSIISTRDLKGQLNYSSIKQFAGVKQYVLDLEMAGTELIELENKLPTAFFALSLKIGDNELKIKPKAPVSGKPSTKADAGPKADFCKFYTNDKNLIKSFVFDSEINDDVKKAEIKHIYVINDIIIPKGETDPAKMRELAVRKGKVIRILKIETNETKKEHEFSA
jgi:hypothetical protein